MKELDEFGCSDESILQKIKKNLIKEISISELTFDLEEKILNFKNYLETFNGNGCVDNYVLFSEMKKENEKLKKDIADLQSSVKFLIEKIGAEFPPDDGLLIE